MRLLQPIWEASLMLSMESRKGQFQSRLQALGVGGAEKDFSISKQDKMMGFKQRESEKLLEKELKCDETPALNCPCFRWPS